MSLKALRVPHIHMYEKLFQSFIVLRCVNTPETSQPTVAAAKSGGMPEDTPQAEKNTLCKNQPHCSTLKPATCNVGAPAVRLPQLLDWLAAHQPDVLAPQKTKLTDD